jgi:TatD DNase family protein
MFSDTHCHLTTTQDRGENLAALLGGLVSQSFRFVLDIGTKPGDLSRRLERIGESANGTIPSFVHFSCGLWPDADVISERADCLVALESDIRQLLARKPAYAALGECGLDRYWNGAPAAERIASRAATATGGQPFAADDGPGTTDTAGEEELFGMQLDMAKRYALPAIIHSRDAFDATLGCIRNADWDRGVIHCWSYGIAEARAFLDRGWYISFPGSITWAKKDADRERIAQLVRYVPRDRLLLETDAPYLTPAPHRGSTNTPLLIRHTYERAADILGIETSALAELVFANASELFATQCT